MEATVTDVTPEPGTQAGRMAREVYSYHAVDCGIQHRTPGPCECTCGFDETILAIEAEATTALRQEAQHEHARAEEALAKKRELHGRVEAQAERARAAEAQVATLREALVPLWKKAGWLGQAYEMEPCPKCAS